MRNVSRVLQLPIFWGRLVLVLDFIFIFIEPSSDNSSWIALIGIGCVICVIIVASLFFTVKGTYGICNVFFLIMNNNKFSRK